MHQYVYPAVFYKDDFIEDSFSVFVPDLNLTTEGTNLEEAYLFASDYLRVFLTYAIKYDMEFNLPSKIESISERFPSGRVMLIDAVIDINGIKKESKI